MNKKRVFQIAAPIAIIIVILTIWIFKNASDNIDSGLATPLNITSVNLDEIHSHGLPVIIDFGSDTCGPCIAMYPALVSLNAQMQGKAIIHFVDVSKYSGAAGDFPLRYIPTQVFYTAQGKPYVPSTELSDKISFTMYSSKASNEHVFTVHEGALTESEMLLILADMGVEQP